MHVVSTFANKNIIMVAHSAFTSRHLITSRHLMMPIRPIRVSTHSSVAIGPTPGRYKT